MMPICGGNKAAQIVTRSRMQNPAKNRDSPMNFSFSYLCLFYSPQIVFNSVDH